MLPGAEFGKLPLMTARIPINVLAINVLTCMALVPNVAAGDQDWIFDLQPDKVLPSASPAAEAAPASLVQHGIPVSRRSVEAWRHQEEWLTERLAARDLRLGEPVHIRIFKQSRELELYLRGESGFELYRVFPVCEMSGTLGPKQFEGDLQAPEGFYDIRPERLHPNSDFHLAFNLGFPNTHDRSVQHTGSNIMIHGGCASNGCFAMTDYYMEQLWLFAEAALRNGQSSIGVEIYPFRMTDENLAAHSASRWIDFWHSLKPAHDHFLETGFPAMIASSDGRYVLADDSGQAADSAGPELAAEVEKPATVVPSAP